jgi:hypothetical protein
LFYRFFFNLTGILEDFSTTAARLFQSFPAKVAEKNLKKIRPLLKNRYCVKSTLQAKKITINFLLKIKENKDTIVVPHANNCKNIFAIFKFYRQELFFCNGHFLGPV